MVQYTAAMVLSVAVLCSMALLSQASPVDWWKSEFAREEEKEILEEVAAHIISELESEMMIQQDEECLQSTFQYRMHAVLTEQFRRVTDGDTGQVEFIFNNLLNFTCISSDYSLFVSKNGGKFEKAINSAIIYTCDLVNRSYQSSIRDKGEPRCAIPCIKLQNIQNGTVSVKGNQPPLENDTAKYSCDSGYQLSGTETRTCGEDGQWSGQEPSCIPQCPELQDIANGDVDYINQQPGANATYSCDPGYVLHGAETRNCGEDGQWSDQEPKCIPQCPELQDIANGVVHYISRQPGGTANYSCNPGYVLQGATTRTCGEDGEWSGQEPRCIPLCPELPPIPFGSVEFGDRKPGDIAKYDCMGDFQIEGNDKRICGQEGKWLGPEPTCVRKCPDPESIFNTTNAKLSSPIDVVDSAGNTLGIDFNYECQPDFVLFVSKRGRPYERAPSDVITYECRRQTGSTFDLSIERNGLPKCFPRCRELPELEYGQIDFGAGNREPGDVVKYSCKYGFRLEGPEVRTCGFDGKWNGTDPECIHVRLCPVLQAPPNGAVNYGNREPGDVATYTCRHGYRLVGPETRMCVHDQDGIPKWSGKPSVCEIITCSPTSLPITDGEFSPSSQGYEVGTVVNYRCTSDRFELRGESSIICLESGEWSHEPPECVAAKCPELRLSGNPRSVDEIRRQIERDRPINYGELLIKYFFTKKIEGNYDEGSKAYLTCENDWKLMPNSPSVQTCVRNSTTGELYWTDPGICWYKYYIIRPAFTGGTG